MKKSNFILLAIGVACAVAGSLSFKAQHRFNGRLFCYTTNGSTGGHTPIPTNAARYTLTIVGTNLFCTVPGPNRYIESIVVQRQ